MHPEVSQWWDTRKEPVQLDFNKIPPPTDAPKPKKVKRGFFLILGAILLRFVGLAIGAACLGFGGWILYQIPQNLAITPIVANVAQGGFLCLVGFLTILAETRMRWTMRGCISTYVMLSSYLARGVFYCFIGAITFALKHQPPFNIKLAWIAGGIVGGGALNLFFYIFYWRFLRQRAIARANAVVRVANPEEIVYGMNTEYIRNNEPIVYPVSQPKPTVDSVEITVTPDGETRETKAVATMSPTPSPPTLEVTTVDGTVTDIVVPSKLTEKDIELKKFGNGTTRLTPSPTGAGAC